MTRSSFTITIAEVARIAHQTNKSYCEALGDTSQLDWEDAPEWQRESAIKGVKFHHEYWQKTRLQADPASSHNSWLKEKRETGWVYGPVKLPEEKKHPCMVEFQDLPIEQQLKDFLFSTVVFQFHPYISTT